MILGSVLCILTAAGLLAVGLARGADPFYVASIAASAVAALALLAGVRSSGSRAVRGDAPDISPGGPAAVVARTPAPAPAPPRPIGRAAVPHRPDSAGDRLSHRYPNAVPAVAPPSRRS